MNALEKLLDADLYRRYVTRDHIADQLMQPSPATVDLDLHIPEMDHTLCRTLEELQGHLEKRDATKGPVFAMTRSLDVHFANLAGTSAPRGETYPGFFDTYAAQVRRLDRCVGAFVGFLKRVDLYDESVIILTSDHGESLGEEGRWGHAYTLFPEVIRIPLIVHLPARLAAGLTTDLTRVAFSTDITPTLYALLGHDPDDLGTLYGAPLFAARGSQLRPRRHDSFLLSSSYGAVYGMLRHNGRQLFIANAIEGRDAQFDLSRQGPGRRTAIAAGDRSLNWELIRAQIAALAAQYRFTPGT
jgi:arylsulfatase A-like enzyme